MTSSARLKAGDFSRSSTLRCWFAVHWPGSPEASPRSHRMPRGGSKLDHVQSASLVLADTFDYTPLARTGGAFPAKEVLMAELVPEAPAVTPGLDARSFYATWYPVRFPDATREETDGGWDHGSARFLAAWEAVSRRATAAVAVIAPQRDQALRELAEAEERAEFYVADRDRERLAAEHHRRMCEELEGELAEARERIRAGVEALKFTLFRPGNGPAHTQALEVVPVEALLGLLCPGMPLCGSQPDTGALATSGESGRTPNAVTAILAAPEVAP